MHGATWTDPDTFELTPDARRFESWEISYAWCLDLAPRLSMRLRSGSIRRGIALESWLTTLARRLAGVPSVRVLDRGPELCAIVTVAVAGRDTKDMKLELRARGASIPVRPSGRTP